jgi:hypothetical protein
VDIQNMLNIGIEVTRVTTRYSQICAQKDFQIISRLASGAALKPTKRPASLPASILHAVVVTRISSRTTNN